MFRLAVSATNLKSPPWPLWPLFNAFPSRFDFNKIGCLSHVPMDTIFSTKGIDADKLFDAAITWVLGPGLRIVLIILLAWMTARIGRTFIQRSLALALHPASGSKFLFSRTRRGSAQYRPCRNRPAARKTKR